MRALFSADNWANGSPRQPEDCGQLVDRPIAGIIELAHGANAEVLDLCVPVRGATRARAGNGRAVLWAVRVPPLRAHIGVVVRNRSGEQVRRIATGSIVAGMTYSHSIGDRAVCQLIRDSVRLLRWRIPGNPNAPVSIRSRARPRPTSIRAAGLVHLRPEPGFNRRPLADFVMMPSNEPDRLSPNPPLRLLSLACKRGRKPAPAIAQSICIHNHLHCNYNTDGAQ